MKLKVNGRTVNATMDDHFKDTAHGHSMLVLENDVIVEPSFAAIHDYRIVEATKAERKALAAAGYELTEDSKIP